MYIIVYSSSSSRLFTPLSRVIVSKSKKRSSSSERAMTAGLTKMLRRFSMDAGGGGTKANKPNLGPSSSSAMTAAALGEDYC